MLQPLMLSSSSVTHSAAGAGIVLACGGIGLLINICSHKAAIPKACCTVAMLALSLGASATTRCCYSSGLYSI